MHTVPVPSLRLDRHGEEGPYLGPLKRRNIAEVGSGTAFEMAYEQVDRRPSAILGGITPHRDVFPAFAEHERCHGFELHLVTGCQIEYANLVAHRFFLFGQPLAFLGGHADGIRQPTRVAREAGRGAVRNHTRRIARQAPDTKFVFLVHALNDVRQPTPIR